MNVNNQVTLIGNVGHNPEARTSESGQTLAIFSLATSFNRKNASGEKTQETQWHRCVSFGKTATHIIEFVKKGNTIAVSGSLNYRTYTDKDNIQRTITEIVVSSVHFLKSANHE